MGIPLKKADIRVTIRGHLFAETEYFLDLAPGQNGLFEAVLPLPLGSTLTGCTVAGEKFFETEAILMPLPKENPAMPDPECTRDTPFPERERILRDNALLIQYGLKPGSLLIRGNRDALGNAGRLQISCVSFLEVWTDKDGKPHSSFRLPLDFPAEEKHIVFETPEEKPIRSGPYVFHGKRPEELALHFPLPEGTFSVLESLPGNSGEAVFAVTGHLSSILPEGIRLDGNGKETLSPIILWDASLSRRGDHSKEITCLKQLLRLMNSGARLIVFRDRPEEPRVFKASEAPEAISAALEKIVYDGGTDWIAAFEEAGKFKSGVVFFFGDPSDTPFSGTTEVAGNLRIFSLPPDHGKIHAPLHFLADRTGIRTPGIAHNSPKQLLEQIGMPEITLESMTIDGVPLPPEKSVKLCGSDGFLAFGRLKAGDHQLELIFDRKGEKFHYVMMLSTRDARPGTTLNKHFKRLGLYRKENFPLPNAVLFRRAAVAGILLPGSAFVLLKDPASYIRAGLPLPPALRKHGPFPDSLDLLPDSAKSNLQETLRGKRLKHWLDFFCGKNPEPPENTGADKVLPDGNDGPASDAKSESDAIRKALADAPPGQAYSAYLAMRDKRLDSKEKTGRLDLFFKTAADFFFARNDNPSGFRILTNLAELHPASPSIRMSLALHFHFRGEPRKAERLLRKNLEELPDEQASAGSRYLLGLVLRNSDPAAAAKEFSRIWQKDPGPAAAPALIEWNRLMRDNPPEHIPEKLRPFIRNELKAKFFVTTFRDGTDCLEGPFLNFSRPAKKTDGKQGQTDMHPATRPERGVFFTPPFMNGYWGRLPDGNTQKFSFRSGRSPETFFLEINSDYGTPEETREIRIVPPSGPEHPEKTTEQVSPPESAGKEGKS